MEKNNLILTVTFLMLLCSVLVFAQDVTVKTGSVVAPISPYIVNAFNAGNETQIIKVKKYVDTLKVSAVRNASFEREMSEEDTKKALDYWKQQADWLGKPFTFFHVRFIDPANSLVGIPAKLVPPQMIAYAKAIGLRTDAWVIGNAPDLLKGRVDESWNEAKYIAAFKEYAGIIRKADPQAKLAGPFISEPDDEWIKTFLKECGGLVDYFAFNYTPAKTNKLSPERIIAVADLMAPVIKKYKGWLKDPKINPKGASRDIKLVVSDWAIHENNNEYMMEMTGAIFSLRLLGIFAREKVDVAIYSCLNGCGNNSLFNRIDKPRILYIFFDMVGQYFGKQLLESVSKDKDVEAIATKSTDSEVSVMIMNKNKEPKAGKTVTVKFDGFTVSSAAGVFLIDDAKSTAPLDAKDLKLAGDSVTVTLKPYSITAFKVKK